MGPGHIDWTKGAGGSLYIEAVGKRDNTAGGMSVVLTVSYCNVIVNWMGVLGDIAYLEKSPNGWSTCYSSTALLDTIDVFCKTVSLVPSIVGLKSRYQSIKFI